MILIVESGASKTDWVCLEEGKPDFHFQTPGMNPVAGFDRMKIKGILREKLNTQLNKIRVNGIYFYGAGCIDAQTKKMIADYLISVFGENIEIQVEDDILGAALSLCPGQKSIIGLIGTGSISAVFDGHKIIRKSTSLGYLISDEGSGYQLGKEVLKAVANQVDPLLTDSWNESGLLHPKDLLHNIYKSPNGNREIAAYASLLLNSQKSPYVRDIILGSFRDYFQWHILRLPEYKNLPLFFSGSIAYYFNHYLEKVSAEYGLSIQKIIKSPLEGLVAYHRK